MLESIGLPDGIEVMKHRHRKVIAFTLVELLVVVSIIALLISILLPSLQRARDQAKQVKCLAHQSGLAKAAISYTTEENDWIPGSPGTSGSMLLGKDWGAANVVDLPRNAVQVYDWMGALAGVQMSFSMPANRVQRWKILVEGIFECPSNRFTAPSWGGTDPEQLFPNQKLVSYNMMRNMLWWENADDTPSFPNNTDVVMHRTIPDGSLLPPGYAPKINQVGQPSEKVFISDGSRFTKLENESDLNSPVILDYDSDWKAGFGGAFADGGPTVQSRYTRSFRLNEPSKFFAYRHRKGRKTGAQSQGALDKSNGLVAAFWDGHGEWMTAAKSRLPDRWWPKGTKIGLGDFNARTRDALIDSVGVGYLSLFDSNNQYNVRR